MRGVVCALLLAGLLGGLVEALRLPQNTELFFPLLTHDSQENSISSSKGDNSFIAEEDTEEGRLWASSDDPDWTFSQSQEDDSDYSQEYDQDYYQDYEYSQEYDQDYYQDYSQEDYSQDYSQEDYIPEDSDSKDSDPSPEDLVPDTHVLATDSTYGVTDALKTKRDTKSHYHTGQVVQVPAAYENYPQRPGISVGVEPLLPTGGLSHHEVAAGVEPEFKVKDSNEESSESSLGGFFRQGWRRFTGKIKDTAEAIGDKAEEVADKVHQKFSRLREKVKGILGRFKVLMIKFGILIQEGVRYCLRRFEHSYDQVRESEVMEKLERKLEEGHAEVAKLFQILGEKITAWRSVQHTSENIDAGLIEGYTQSGQQHLQEGQQTQNIEQEMPDFFQYREVQSQLNTLVIEGVLTENDVIILTEEHSQQDQHNEQHQHHNQNYNSQQQNQQTNPTYIQFPH